MQKQQAFLLISLPLILSVLYSFGMERSLRPLDLPSGGVGAIEDEEPAPEVITFYGSVFEGNGFFWCLDISCSMTLHNRIDILKMEATRAIQSLSTASDFGIVAFNDSSFAFSMVPREADAVQKMLAINWVTQLTPTGTTCLGNAGVITLKLSRFSRRSRKTMIVVSDGQPNCQGNEEVEETLIQITEANTHRIAINTIYVGSDNGGIEFMQDLATRNGGTFTLVGM